MYTYKDLFNNIEDENDEVHKKVAEKLEEIEQLPPKENALRS